MLTRERMYQAIVEKDTTFEGTFFTAVKTTGIFCRPSCTARKPKLENVEFVTSAKEAIQKGYRPCKVCRPLEKSGETPAPIRELLEALYADPSKKFRDGELVALGLEPSTVRRWFLKNHGITFHAYQRMFRLNSAFRHLREGAPVTGTAFEAGYDSLSGFADSFKSVFGVAPSNSRSRNVVNVSRLETPLGTMFACAAAAGICLLEFSDRKMLETELKDIARLHNAEIIPGLNPHFDTLRTQLDEYFEGKRKSFSVPLFMPGTPFQQQVWQLLLDVPFGTTSTYKRQAQTLGSPSAIRAVARANGMNRISILVPCHRIISEDGQLTGYGGGVHRKQWLLDHEKKNA
ncbi:bifunctional transcriptional activator/DNA repair enzyme AdaA [Chitinophaga rhizosphaerae]|uniref:bifunctional transcriptional activator/DNA repair enzyme AdaA n=1 Tax=Chitinophaga rhizosphaerae TaxID=1864947 RepID=UPI000F80FB8C|nr:methylated-DNA--[protein]-cysteine S-methyltransferase [Chitinophaga rhizosphaerae]